MIRACPLALSKGNGGIWYRLEQQQGQRGHAEFAP